MFAFLKGEMVKKNISVKEIADRLGIAEKTMRNKLHGVTEFTWAEVCIIQEEFFPEFTKDILFKRVAA